MLDYNTFKTKRANRFMTTKEVKILWHYSKKWGLKWQLMIAYGLFRGLRIGEITAINMYDFEKNYTTLNIILEKSKIKDKLPLPLFLSKMTRFYINKNLHRLKNGFLFPTHSTCKRFHMSTPVAEALMCKFRKIIGKEHPCFLEKISDRYYRIGWHSLRRYHETFLYEKYHDIKLIRDLMRYKDTKTVNTYLDPYEIWKQERAIIEDSFGGLQKELILISKNQTKLTDY